MKGFCCIEGLVGTYRNVLCPSTRPCGWTNSEAKKINLDVKDVLVHFIMGDRDSGHRSLCTFMCIHIFAFHLFAAVMHLRLLGTSQLPPTAISLT